MGKILSLLSDKKILKLSKGEVTNYGHYNFKYNEPRPIVNGLFCQKIFGPIIDFTCECGITKTPINLLDNEGEKCVRCGIEHISSKSRYNRFGHIDLNCYYLNPLFTKVVSEVLGISKLMLESIMSGNIFVSLKYNPAGALFSARENYSIELDSEGNINSINSLVLEMNKLDILGEETLKYSSSGFARKYDKLGYTLYDLFNRLILVSPPNDRPMRNIVSKENVLTSRIGYDEKNVIYTRLSRDSLRIVGVEQNEELPPEVKYEIINSTSLIVQKLIRMFYLEGADYGAMWIPPKIDILKGKEGIIRGNLLGKRVDFSGRSSITSDPSLDLDQIGLPIDMIYVLSKPIVIRELIQCIKDQFPNMGKAFVIRNAIKEYKNKTKRAINLSINISKSLFVLVNRAPSLHRYSVMSFRIKAHHDSCIYFPPLACTPFNADFDGDTVGIHLLLTDEAVEETKITSYKYNLMSSADMDKPNATLSNEMAVGCYLLSKMSNEIE